METLPTPKYNKKIRAAVSREIIGSHQTSLAGHIDWKLNKQGVRIKGKKIVDIFFM